jgi:hypothetical protein
MKSQPIFRINRLQIGLERKPGIAKANSNEEDNQQELMGKTLKNAWNHMEIQGRLCSGRGRLGECEIAKPKHWKINNKNNKKMERLNLKRYERII